MLVKKKQHKKEIKRHLVPRLFLLPMGHWAQELVTLIKQMVGLASLMPGGRQQGSRPPTW